MKENPEQIPEENTFVNKEENLKFNANEMNVIVLDMTLVQFVDETGVKCLNLIYDEYTKDNVRFLFTNCNGIYLIIFILFILTNNIYFSNLRNHFGIFKENELL
jgi:anti-anti-sigma regulatory factor